MREPCPRGLRPAFGNVLCVASALLSDARPLRSPVDADDPGARALGQAAVAASGPETVVWLDPARVALAEPPAAYVCRGHDVPPPVFGEDEPACRADSA